MDRLEVYSVGILFAGERFGFRALALNSRSVPVEGVEVTWTSSNPGVVEAQVDGTMVTHATGWAVVEASAGDERERMTVRVTSEPAHGLVLSAFPTFGDPQLHVLTLGAASQIRTLHQGAGLQAPVASPDGSRYAFVMETLDGGRDLLLVDADGSGLLRLTTNPGPDDQPSWSPDGGSIAFRSGVNGRLDVWVIEVDGRRDPPSFLAAPETAFHLPHDGRRAGGARRPTSGRSHEYGNAHRQGGRTCGTHLPPGRGPGDRVLAGAAGGRGG
ncbi:MAG: hypothetical protein RQ751_04060 [Longimicrobiales bacterium]|nr:hypothetical protein [Longimicrobiales bacterium]